MDHAAIIALATALEIEFDGLRRQLKALSETHDADTFEDQTNALIDHLPSILAGTVGAAYARTTLESILATHYAEGVATTGAVRNTGKLMRPERAYAAVVESGLLQGAVNPIRTTKEAIEVRAAAVAKVLKGQIVQDLRTILTQADNLTIDEARNVVAEAARSLEDLASNPHVQRHTEAQADLAKGYGIFTAQQTENYLRAHPFQEFYRAEHRVEWRDWPTRWTEQGGRFYPGVSDYPQGRMIAETNSKIWEDLSNPALYRDATGSPYPPFAWNSGMSVKPVSVSDAKKLGLYGRHQIPPKPRKLNFNASISFSVEFDDDIKSALLDSMQDWVEQKGEVVHR